MTAVTLTDRDAFSLGTAFSAFLARIEANPADATVKLVFADWLDDHDEFKLAAAYRWCGEHGRHPWVKEDFCWWDQRRIMERAADNPTTSYVDDGSDLPAWLWDRLEDRERDYGFAEYSTLDVAMQAIADHLEPIP